MKSLRFLTKCLCFFIIFSFLFFIVQEHLRDKWMEGEYDVSVKIDGFYAQEPDTLDVVFIGSSQMYADMAPAVLFDRFGITSYDFCANEQPLWVSYYYIKEAIRTQHPKVIVLDVFTVYGDDYEDEGVMHINLDDLPMNRNKMHAIQDGVPKELRYSYYFPIAKYHNTWTDLYQDKVKASFYHEKDPNKGYSPFIFAGEYEESAKEEVVLQKEKEPLPERAAEWLLKIVDLCKTENIPLVLIKTPNGNAERQKLYNSVEELAFETDTPFYNMNTILDGQAHINILQAEKVSILMGEYLTKHYTFEDKRNNPAYDEWKESVHLFERQKNKCEIISSNQFDTYLPLLTRDGYYIFITYKNEFGNTLDQKTLDYFNQILHLQFEPDNQTEYFAVLEDGSVLLQSSDSNESVQKTETGISTHMLLSDGKHAPLDLNIQSSGALTDGQSSIIINGTDFSMNCDGFNIAIYDKYLGEMIEMSAFDLNDNLNLLRK